MISIHILRRWFCSRLLDHFGRSILHWCPAYERKWKEWKQGNTIKEKHLAAKEEKTVYQAKHEAYIFLSTVRLENKSSDEKFRTKFKLSDMREYQLDTDLQRLVLQRIKVNACLLTYYQHCVWTCLQERRSLWKFFMIFVIYLLVWSLYESSIVLPVVYCVCVKHIFALKLLVFFFLFFCQPYPEYRGTQSKKLFSRPSNG